MAAATKPKPRKIVNRTANGKFPSQESLLANVLNGIQSDIRELRTDIKRLDEKGDSNFKWTLGIMVTLIAFVFMVMFFLHSNLKSDIAKLEANLKSDISEIKSILKKDKTTKLK